MTPSRRPQPEENVDSWLMSYADMITLLLCFFIIFVSISEPKKERITAITDGMAGRFGTVDMSTPFQGTYQTLLAIAQKHQLFKDFDVTKSENSLDMELASESFFKPGTAELNPDKLPALTEMAEALKKTTYIDYRIVVQGHTSDVPPANTALYPSNWEFSAARAARLARFFVEQGIPASAVEAAGYADSQPEVPNLDESGKPIADNRAKNDRIVIQFERAM